MRPASQEPVQTGESGSSIPSSSSSSGVSGVKHEEWLKLLALRGLVLVAAALALWLSIGFWQNPDPFLTSQTSNAAAEESTTRTTVIQQDTHVGKGARDDRSSSRGKIASSSNSDSAGDSTSSRASSSGRNRTSGSTSSIAKSSASNGISNRSWDKSSINASYSAGSSTSDRATRSASGDRTDLLNRPLSKALQSVLQDPWNHGTIPVVEFMLRTGRGTCKRSRYVAKGLAQARKLNSAVYLIGPRECADLAAELDIVLDPYTDYQDVLDWFQENVGDLVGYQVRWFVLRAFMQRHAFPRVFYMDSDVLLFANITQLAEMHFQRVPLVLSVRWPSLQSLGPSQYATIAVAGHVSMWTYDALSDFLAFFVIFVKEAVLVGKPGDKSLVSHRAYNDMVPLGWYTHKVCWLTKPEELHPPCIADAASGVTANRSARIRGKFMPRFDVESFAMPRWCNKTEWSDEGWCVLDNNFAVEKPHQFFRYRPEEGMKTPQSMHYTYYRDWSKEQQPQTLPVQFLAVHFQGGKKKYMDQPGDPAKTWGSSDD